MHLVSVSSSQVQTVPVTSPVLRASSSPRASPTSTHTTWSAPSSSSSRPAWTWPSASSPSTWRTTPCRAETGTASTTGWRCGTGCREVRLPIAMRFWVFLGDEPFSRADTVSAVKTVCTLPCLHHYRLRWSSRYFSSAALVDESWAYRQDAGTHCGETT